MRSIAVFIIADELPVFFSRDKLVWVSSSAGVGSQFVLLSCCHKWLS